MAGEAENHQCKGKIEAVREQSADSGTFHAVERNEVVVQAKRRHGQNQREQQGESIVARERDSGQRDSAGGNNKLCQREDKHYIPCHRVGFTIGQDMENQVYVAPNQEEKQPANQQ